VHGTVSEAKGGGRIAGAPELTLHFTEVELDGESYPIVAESFHVQGRNDAGKSAAEIGGGAVAGGILGRVVGGKGGTLPGAVVGAAIGTGVAMQSEGDQLVLHTGQLLRVRLTAPATVKYRVEESPTELQRR
jgi:outer membrane lipoprotein SlyB